MTHEAYMQRAIALAKQGSGFVNPNPLVGAVIVKDGRIIGEGYHMKYGTPHAERNALANCTEDPAGAEMYVTLEPCCHYGKNPPCTEAVIAAGIRKVNYYTYGALAGGRAVYDIAKTKPDGLQFHDVAVAATDAITDDIKRVMKVLGAR